jgi:phenylacetate-CoA ligase
MQDFGTTVVHATPSFLLHVESKMQEAGIPRESLSLKKAFAGAEPYSEDTRRRIESLLNIDRNKRACMYGKTPISLKSSTL